MSKYALIEANAIVNVIEWDGVAAYRPPNGATLTPLSQLPAGAGVGWVQGAGGAWSAPAAPPPQQSGLTFLQFIALFTPAEQAAIVASSDAQVRLFVVMASGAGAIDLTNAEVVAGVNYLAGVGLITSAEATRILAGIAP
jgi:hypothetical protein